MKTVTESLRWGFESLLLRQPLKLKLEGQRTFNQQDAGSNPVRGTDGPENTGYLDHNL